MAIEYTLPEPGQYGNPEQSLVIITAKCHPWLIEKLAEKYWVDYEPAITYETLAAGTKAEGLILTTRLRIDAALIDAAPNLKWIGRLGSGLELIDVAYAESKGIRVYSSPEGNSNAVGEHALGLLLALLNRISWSHNEVKQHLWLRDENRGTELSGKTVGIIGFGNTGNAFARLLQPFGVTVLGYDKVRYGFARDHIKEASLEQIQRYADVISFHVPLTEETTNRVNADFISNLKNAPILLNTSRGKVIDLNALQKGLQKGLVGGAGLDVIANEKPATWTETDKTMINWLTSQPNVILTPHIAGYSHEAFLKMAQVIYRKIFE